jgi:ketosteroid isomerase-like protein
MMGKKTPWLAMTMIALAAACAPQDSGDTVEYAETTADEGMMDTAAAEAAMDRIEADYIAAYNAGDAAGLASLWAPDGTQAPPLTGTLDRAGVEETYAASFAEGIPMELEVMRDGMVASGDMAVGWGGFVVTMTPAEGEPIVTSGRYGVVIREEPDGSWKILRHMFNYEVPPPGFGMMEEMEM